MLSTKRVSLLLAATLFASLLVFLVATYNIGETKASAKTLRSKLLRRHDRTKEKPDATELDTLRKNAQAQKEKKEERELEDKLPKYLPIKVKIRAEKEKAFKDIDNDYWARDLEVEVKNTGTRPIYYMVLLLDMPELKFGQSNMIFDLRFGEKKFMNFASGAKPEDISLKPNETCILKIKNPPAWTEFSRDMYWPKPKQFVLLFQEISFGDGTGFRSSYDGPWPPPPKQPGVVA